MKKYIGAFVCALLALCLTGCGNNLSKTEYTIATGNKTGVYYPIAKALSQILKQEYPDVNIKIIETAGSYENIQLISEGKADLALIQNDMAYYAYNGEAMFNGQKITNISGLATLFPEVVQFVVKKNIGIESMEDLAGHKIAVGTKDSGTYYNAQQILSTAGVWDTINHVYINSTKAINELLAGNIDGFVFTTGLPNPSIVELGKATEIQLLQLSTDLVQKLVSTYSFYYPSVVDPFQYPGQPEKVYGLEINAILASGPSLDENDQYLLTKALFSKPNELGQSHPRLSKLTKITLRHQMAIQLGKGAAKAYSEQH